MVASSFRLEYHDSPGGKSRDDDHHSDSDGGDLVLDEEELAMLRVRCVDVGVDVDVDVGVDVVGLVGGGGL